MVWYLKLVYFFFGGLVGWLVVSFKIDRRCRCLFTDDDDDNLHIFDPFNFMCVCAYRYRCCDSSMDHIFLVFFSIHPLSLSVANAFFSPSILELTFFSSSFFLGMESVFFLLLLFCGSSRVVYRCYALQATADWKFQFLLIFFTAAAAAYPDFRIKKQ